MASVRKRGRKIPAPHNGRLPEGLAISEAYRDAGYAAALARAEELMRDPDLKKRIDHAILDVLEGMVIRLKQQAKD